jgi:hypothetical protein
MSCVKLHVYLNRTIIRDKVYRKWAKDTERQPTKKIQMLNNKKLMNKCVTVNFAYNQENNIQKKRKRLR